MNLVKGSASLINFTIQAYLNRPPEVEETKILSQTNLQLFGQLQRQGYSRQELTLIRDAHGLAAQLFTGLHRPSGKTFIAHVIGTASSLGDLHARPTLIAAALLHAAYEHGDFGDGTKGISATKRDLVRQVAGQEVENYVARYFALRWNKNTIDGICDGFNEMGALDRDVLLMRLANELDDLRDLGVLYCCKAEAKRHHYGRFGPVLVETADKLGFPHLAVELERALAESASAEILSDLRSREPGVILIPPKSYYRRPATAVRQELARINKRFARSWQIVLDLSIRLKCRWITDNKQVNNPNENRGG